MMQDEKDLIERAPLRDSLTSQALILVSMALMALGAVMVYSTAGAGGSSGVSWYYRREIRQLMFVGAGILVLLTLWRMDYQWLVRRPWAGRRLLGWVPTPATILMFLGLLLSVVVLVAGHQARGKVRAFQLGAFNFQPAEMVKFLIIIFLAAFLSRAKTNPRSFLRTFLPLMTLVGLAVAAVIKQDFDTAFLLGIGGVAVMIMGGVPWYYFLLLVPPAYLAYYKMIFKSPYHWYRMVATTQPFDQGNPSAYQPREALIAVGLGADPAGPGGGMAKYGYLPEHSSDYIFAGGICEELGLLGAALVIGLFLAFLLLTWRASTRAPNRFGALLAGGTGFLIVLQATLHIAVNLNCAPATGTGLPFISYGGSSLLMMAAAVAMMVSVATRRRANAPPQPAAPVVSPPTPQPEVL